MTGHRFRQTRREALRRLAGVSVLALLLTAGCGIDRESQPLGVPLAGGEPPSVPALDPNKIDEGAKIYGAHCASCHAAGLAGEADWQTPNPDGSFKAPPHDSSGHTWHHSDRQLVDLVLYGSSLTQSRMPAFEDRLTEAEVESVLEFFKAQWGPEERAWQWQVTWQESAQRR